MQRPPNDGLIGPDRPLATSLICAAIVAGLTFLLTPRDQAQQHLPKNGPTTPIVAQRSPTTEPGMERARFFDETVEPQIRKTDRLNRQASERAIKRIQQVLAGYHRGVKPFVSDLTSMSTRFGIVRRMPGQWWRKDARVSAYVQEKFEKHLFSEEKLVNDIGRVLNEFKNEVRANQSRMLIDVRAALGESDLPEIKMERYEPFFRAVAKHLQEYSARRGTASVYNAVAVFVISEVGVFATRSIVSGLLARFGTAALASLATGAGATAGAAATGAGGGSLAGPVGTAVGFGVGIAIGLIIDWWMTDHFEAEVGNKMHRYIETLGTTILRGSVSQSTNGPNNDPSVQPGLIEILPTVCDGLADAYRQRFYEQIVTAGESR